jgi:YegS/Rv2252/BmrU family lipid kinase
VNALVLANAAAGSADDDAVEAAVEQLGRTGEVELARTGGPEDLDRALDALGERTLIVAGGDGSLHLVVQRLHDRGQLNQVTIGLVPLGTGNDFARGAEVPLDPVEAAAALSTAAPRPVDLVVDERGGVVINVAHAGLGAEAAERSTSLKGALGPLAYPVGALLAGVRESGWDLEVTVDGDPVGDGPVLMVGVGNGRTIGGGTPLCPTAVLDDGLVDVVVVNATGPAARTAFAAALRRGTHLDREDVHHTRGRTVSISGDPIRHNADGEVSDELASRSYEVVAGAWSFLGSADV